MSRRTRVRAGDELVTRLLREIGYPTDDYDERLATLSVEHARDAGPVTARAHDISLRNEQGAASTEQLRQALVDYRGACSPACWATSPCPRPRPRARSAEAENPPRPKPVEAEPVEARSA